MAAYLIRTFKAQRFAELDPDVFFRYDEKRPVVHIEEGIFKNLSSPGGTFYAAQTAPDGRDLVILKADEPNLRWFGFVDELLKLCSRLHIETIITLGSMYDHVLHTDRILDVEAKRCEFNFLPGTQCHSLHHPFRGPEKRYRRHKPVVSLPLLSAGYDPLWNFSPSGENACGYRRI
jgi:hypothetical protein